ncbi:MAG: hypothetical protein A2Y34_15385 [Spirochaetes bacterium GWC1_27_15]|nr:MAG: hypothetical protein A2Z98_09245 [Spirochaetes bacterium GWB1_27_13]OHD23682.1 MAG: hypothetical protein A2Y34_15385 [Spirochaetes bacterium GWC1_27_15]
MKLFNKKNFLHRNYLYINRYREIISILIKYGFNEFVYANKLTKYLNLGTKGLKKKNKNKIQYTSSERIRMVFEELGPTFIKFGQIISNRPDLVPDELLIELEKLQEAVPPFPAEYSIKTIESELKNPINILFREFNPVPIASASIAQVHKAILHSGEVVAVKVQRPNISQIIETDIEIMFFIATLIEKHIHGLDILNPTGIIKEFERTIKKEVDFRVEASHIEHFFENFKNDSNIYVPKIYRNFSTKKVLTMEFIDGVKLSNINSSNFSINPKLIAERGVDAILKQIFNHGFFHADPHPGNILILKNNTICFLDFGMMGALSKNHKEQLGNIILGIVYKDSKRITDSVEKISESRKIDNKEQVEVQIFELLEEFAFLPLKNINMGDILNRLIVLIISNKIKISPNFYLLIKALITAEGVGRKLNPDFNIIKHIEPFARNIILDRLNPFNLAEEAYFSANNYAILFRDLPKDLKDILEQIKNGKIKVEFEHRGVEPIIRKYFQITNHTILAIILSAIIIGSSVIIHSGISPKLYDIPLVGIIGFLGAGILGVWLIIAILRDGKK